MDKFSVICNTCNESNETSILVFDDAVIIVCTNCDVEENVQ